MNDAADFDAFLDQAWTDHAGDPAAVAARLSDTGAALARSPGHVASLVQLAHHCWGEHLGRWAEGRAEVGAFAAHRFADATTVAAVRRALASLDLSAGRADALAGLEASDAIRATAMAAANLAERDTARAAALFEQALQAAAGSALPVSDPMHRALAVTGNNLACTLEEKPQRSAAERELMLRAAEVARHEWAIAGGWLETERAEYRLAMACVAAGELQRAGRHARQCVEIVQANDGAPLERFFAFEALGTVARASGDLAGHGEALTQTRAAFDALDESDRGWVRASLEKLAAA